MTLSGGRRRSRKLPARPAQEGIDALDYVTHLIEDEKLYCDWSRSGRFHAAHNPKQFEALVKLVGSQPKGLDVPMEIVTRAEQRREIGSDAYYGGIVYPRHSALHPGKFHLALLKRAQAAGAIVIDHCAALSIDRASGGFTVKTAKGTLQARDVIVATNGYSGPLTPWHRRRVIPIGSYIIATEELDPAQGGGVTYRQGAHQFDVIRLLGGGMVESVSASAFDFDPGRPTIGAHNVTL